MDRQIGMPPKWEDLVEEMVLIKTILDNTATFEC